MATRHITQQDRGNAERLKAIWMSKKKSLQLTQVKAAALLGLAHQSTISQYLNCEIALNTDIILKFARLLEVDPVRIDPSLRELVVRELRPGGKKLSVICRVVLSDLGTYCVKEAAIEDRLINPFVDDLPQGTTLKGVEVGTAAYHPSFGLPHNSVAYILQNAEPGINDVMFVEQEDCVGFYRYNGRSDTGLLLTDPLTGKTLNVALAGIKATGVLIGHHATDLSRRARWELRSV